MEESTETTTRVLLVEKEPLTCTKHLLLNFHIISLFFLCNVL